MRGPVAKLLLLVLVASLAGSATIAAAQSQRRSGVVIDHRLGERRLNNGIGDAGIGDAPSGMSTHGVGSYTGRDLGTYTGQGLGSYTGGGLGNMSTLPPITQPPPVRGR